MQITISTTQILIAIIFLLMFIIIFSIFDSYIYRSREPKIIERVITKNPLDIQFSKENFPSNVHNEMFVKSTPWIGGYGLGIGKTYTTTVPSTSTNTQL